MFHVFHVDTGTTYVFDLNYALAKGVTEIKETIERECGVATGDQVLLMSGGESLESNVRLCSCSAGTETNPIFLFSKASIDSPTPPPPSLDYGSDVDLQMQVDASLELPATYQTLAQREKLAQQCVGLARDQSRICERLVEDQHRMQQGWSSVSANLDDLIKTFSSRAATLEQNFTSYLSERQQYLQLLRNFPEDMVTLAKIPILPALRAQADNMMEDVEEKTEQEQQQQQQQQQEQEEQPEQLATALVPTKTTSHDSPHTIEALSLLKWISAKDNQNSLEQVADQCAKVLVQLDENVLEGIKNETRSALVAASNMEMKEIKGLTERLIALEQLLVQSRKLVQEQSELAQGFHQNKTRVSNLNDTSVLPDLCLSHRHQLLVMLQNHNQLRDIRRRCSKAKEELSVNIHQRLKWVMHVENRIMEIDGKLVMYHESLRRLRRQLEVLRQIHHAPEMYVSAIAEVVRRRVFSQAFLAWASNLACQLVTVHNEEIERRREFQTKFEGHFLNTLFPGLEDAPPPFATQAPAVFDNGLPKLTPEDMESLKVQIPDLAASVSSPDLNSVTQFFSKSITDSSSDGNKDKESTSMPVDEPATKLRDARPPLLSDRGGFESETDTEEFEKIGQAAMDSKQTSCDSMKQQLSQQSSNSSAMIRQKQLEENLGSTREEVERLREIIRQLRSVASESMQRVRDEMSVLKEQTTEERMAAAKVIGEAVDAVRMHTCALRRREQELTVDHELELADVKKLLQTTEDQLLTVRSSLADKEAHQLEHEKLVSTFRQKFDAQCREISKMHTVCRQIEERLEQSQIEKENAIKESNEVRLLETKALKTSLENCQEKIKELEGKLVACEVEHMKAMKEEIEKLQMEHKTEVDNIRSRFKLMTASAMERSPSDSSLEKIEHIELINHETILAQAKKDLETEKEEAIRSAIERERAALSKDLQAANDVISKHKQELSVCRQREVALIEECRVYKSKIENFDKVEAVIQNLEEENKTFEHTIVEERKRLEERENFVRDLEEERDRLKQELEDERLKMSQTNIELGDSLKTSSDSDKDLRVSESKKVRLEEDSESLSIGRIESALETDNKRLNSELRAMKDSKEQMESKIEALENERIRLEAELVKERSVRNGSAEYLSSLISSESSRDKDMSASVAVVSEMGSLNRVDASTSTERSSSSRREASSSSHSISAKLTKSTTNLVQQGKINFTSCNPGDIVLVAWDQAHHNYILFQESQTYYFLNSDCLADLDLKLGSDGLPTKLHTVAEVVEKEYCSARKPENRYRVPLGTRFYRVRVKPLQRHAAGKGH